MLLARGVEKVTSLDDKWKNNPGVYVIVATEGFEMVGGVRVHLYDEAFKLPLEEAVGHLDSGISMFVKHRAHQGTAEACGQWLDVNIKKSGLSFALIRCAMVICEQLKIRHLLGFAPAHALGIYESVGYRPLESFGPDGGFPYPDERYRTQVILADPYSLDLAAPREQKLIPRLRKFNRQKISEVGELGSLLIHYDLKIRDIRDESARPTGSAAI